MKEPKSVWLTLTVIAAFAGIGCLAFKSWERNTLERFKAELNAGGYSPDQLELKFRNISMNNAVPIGIDFEVTEKDSGFWTCRVITMPLMIWKSPTIQMHFVKWAAPE